MKVSIVVAAYNVETYIERCIESLMQQTFENIEIIVVNDGSTDNTLDKIKSLSKLDNRILVINQENRGVMQARKSGYNIATGEYILFVDGDDWLKKTAIESLYCKAISNNSDIVCYKFIYIDDNGSERKSHLIGDFITFDEINNNEFLRNIMLFKIIPSIWSKFIKREFIQKNNINIVNSLRYAEDLVVSCELGMYSPKVSMLDEYLYYYYQRKDSVTKKIDDKVFDISRAVLNIKNSLNEKNIYTKFEKEFEYLCFFQNYLEMIRVITDFEGEYSKDIYREWKKSNINISKNKFIKEKLSNQSLGYRVALGILNKSYFAGKMYYKIRRF